jgi:hypothetical protein
MSFNSTGYVRPERADLSGIVAATRRESPRLSASALLRLGQHFEAALRNRSAGRSNLRAVVAEVVHEALSQGGSPDAAIALVERFLSSHPSLHSLDRTSFIDGTPTSERLLNDVRKWAAEGAQPDRLARAP